MSRAEARETAALLADLMTRIEALERADRLANSSIEDGSLDVYDDGGTIRQVIGQQDDGTYTITDLNGPIPPTPTLPIVQPVGAGLLITWDGMFADVAQAPADFSHVEVHVAAGDTFEATDANQVTTFGSLKGGSYLIALPQEPHAVILQTVSTSHTESVPTVPVAATPLPVVADSANGTNRVWYSDVTPPVDPAIPHRQDDTWFQTNAEGNIVGLFRWDETSGTWQPREFNHEVIATLDLGKATVGYLHGSRIEAETLGAAQIDADAIFADRMTVGSAGVNTLTNGTMEDPAIEDGAVNANGFGGWAPIYAENGGAVITENKATPISGTRSMRLALGAVTATQRVIQTKVQPVTGGQRWYVSAKVRADRTVDKTAVAGENVVNLTFHTSNGMPADAPEPPSNLPGPNVRWQDVDSREALTGGEVVTLSGVVIVPVGDVQMLVSVQADAADDGLGGYTLDVDEVYCYPATTTLEVIGADGSTVASVNDDGDATFRDLDLTGDFRISGNRLLVDGLSIEEQLAPMSLKSNGILAWGALNPAVNGIGTDEYGIMQMSAFIPEPRLGLWHWDWSLYPQSGSKYAQHNIRTNHNDLDAGAFPANTTNTSPVIETFYHDISGANVSTNRHHMWIANLAAGWHRWRWSVKLVGAGTTTAANANMMWMFVILDVGPTGQFEQSAGAAPSPGPLVTGGSAPAPAPEPAPTKQKYTKTWTATWTRGYNGGGAQISAGANHDQGYWSGTNGNTKAAIGFNDVDIRQKLNGVANADILKVEVYLYYNHWYYNSGGTAIIGTHSDRGIPGSWDAIAGKQTDQNRSANWPKPGGRWVDVTGMGPGFKSGSNTGFLIGPGPNTSKEFYGTFNGASQNNPPKLRITYKK